MFVERLTNEQLESFVSNILIAYGAYSIEKNCTITIENPENASNKVVYITTKFNTDYCIRLDIYDFNIFVWKDKNLIFDIYQDNFSLFASYIKFMYEAFGDEYKVLYKDNAKLLVNKLHISNTNKDLLLLTLCNVLD